MPDHYDVIVIGSGPGGASLAQRLAPTGKRILILERGEYLERSEKNWSAQTVFVDGEYQAHEIWTNSRGETFSPAQVGAFALALLGVVLASIPETGRHETGDTPAPLN